MTGVDMDKRAAEDVLSPTAKAAKVSQLARLKEMTSVVADTGDFEAMEKYKPDDATTNPSLLLAAVQLPKYEPFLNEAIAAAKAAGLTDEALVNGVCDRLAVRVGCKILEVLPPHGRVSTEVDANLSFSTAKSVEKARELIKLYDAAGIPKERVLIKLGSTWESIQACKQLEAEGINCNMTLLFSFAQAVACAEAGATLISPFVGRILDWYKKNTDKKEYTPDEDPGVKSVRAIYKYYKAHGHKTIVMGASFRNTGEIIGLAGCDKLTISPKLLEDLANEGAAFSRALTPEGDGEVPQKVSFDEAAFRWAMNEDPMATEKLAEGIRNFNKDFVKLTDFVKQRLS